MKRAIDLADRMLPAFDTTSGLPLPSVNLAKSVGVHDQHSPQQISTAEAATLQLEFKYLAHLTRNEEYWRKAEKVMAIINKAKLPNSLVPIFMRYVIVGRLVSDGSYCTTVMNKGRLLSPRSAWGLGATPITNISCAWALSASLGHLLMTYFRLTENNIYRQ